MIPFEFTIEGPPVSAQTKTRARLQAWKHKIRQAAIVKVPQNAHPVTTEVRIVITYFYDTAAADVDNIAKPIQDALNGLIYVDDAQVSEASIRKSQIDGAFRIRGLSTDVAVKLAEGREFLRIRVLSAPNHEDLQ